MLYVVHVLSKGSLMNPTSLPYKLLYLDANLQKRERLTKKVSSSFLTVGRTLIFYFFSFFNSCHSEATCRPLRSTLPGKIFCKPFLKRKKYTNKLTNTTTTLLAMLLYQSSKNCRFVSREDYTFLETLASHELDNISHG